ncbi:armadillo repeat kinesin 3 [Striga asiatica]|uniref:Kinesin-like protein n=1 Tax=Striga asiatica TaxID=4170 RepID=A0A5A7PP77_STRAF|nr:armadillo repeat kinesin 3 [Striga asiatica]
MSTNSFRNGGSMSRGGGGTSKFENHNSRHSSASVKSKVQQSAATSRRTSSGSSRDASAGVVETLLPFWSFDFVVMLIDRLLKLILFALGYGSVSGRVRVAVRLRPPNSEEMVADADFADCVELQPELKRLKLRRNNWDSDTYEFDEVLTEFASQKRVYEVVAKPVVESVLDGYNGTVMAYGQTGTGKTYTLGRLGEKDAADRGIMLRAMEDILAEISPESDVVCVSYFQLYMETVQDLLNPANDNISIVEDPKSGDVSLPGATVVEIRDHKSFVELLQLGEAHRFAANTKLNTESSRSHAILMVHIKRSAKGKKSSFPSENGNMTVTGKTLKPPIVRKSKLVIVDLAGSERIDKSGSEGHTLDEAKSINLSLSALGKCINALAENSAHVPVRDSKLTRLLRDSFGGTARTSLIITIGPSPRHRGETSSTIMFGQRAMKVENMVKIKEEFDYKSLSRRLEMELDKLIAEHERQQNAFQVEIERIALEAERRVSEVEQNYGDALEEKLKCQKECMESVKKLEEEWTAKEKMHGHRQVKVESFNDGMDPKSRNVIVWLSFCSFLENTENKLEFQAVAFHKLSLSHLNILGLNYIALQPPMLFASGEVAEIKKKLQNEILLRKAAEAQVHNLENQLSHWKTSEAARSAEILKLREMLEDEELQKAKLEEEIQMLQSQLLQISFEADEVSSSITLILCAGIHHAVTVGLHKILSLLESEDADVRIHAVKVVANLAAEESNQERIVEAGGLTCLLALFKSSNDETIHRVAAGAIANLAMNETNQELIMCQGGISLLSVIAAKAEDPQTLRMVAGAIANLCGNVLLTSGFPLDKLLAELRAEGGIKALLAMVRCRHPDVLAQVARGIANFAKCESRASTQGTRSGRSVLIEDGVLPWIVQNANNEASPIRRHIELALCHLGQHEINAKEMIVGGALWELVRISRDCSREDIRTLAQRILKTNSSFQAELRKLRINPH